MEKLKLPLGDLVVESFAPMAATAEVGTVRADASGPYTDECVDCGPDSFDPCASVAGYLCTGSTCQGLTCEGNTCAAGAYTCDGDTCYNHTCSFPDCTKVGVPC